MDRSMSPVPAPAEPVAGPAPGTHNHAAQADTDIAPGLMDLAARLREDQQQRWRRGERPVAEDYLQQHPPLAGCSEAALDIIYAEILLRQEAGETVNVEEYVRRFPHLENPLRRQFQLHQALLSGAGLLSDVPLAHPSASESLTVAPTDSAGSRTQPPSVAPDTLTPPGSAADGGSVPGYEILGALGQGGMGVVYRARQLGLNRVVALKMIRPHFVADPEALARFRAEAEAVARLQHPHIVGVYAWGEHRGAPYFALEYCPGGSLSAALQGQPQSPVQSARLVHKIARAVQAAHDAGIVHRDLKPANVLLAPAGDEPALSTPWGVPKVADFGLCRTFHGDVRLTASGALAGSPPYMAPEQAEGRSADIGPATDVWALGAILYEMLTGQPPFGAGSLPAVLHAVCYEDPPRPSELRPEVPAELEALCLRCLRKRREDRYARAADVVEALADWLAHSTVPGGPAGADAGRPAHPLPPRAPSTPLPVPLRRRRWMLAAVLMAAMLGLAAWAWSGRTLPPPADTSAASAANVLTQATPVAKPLTIRMRLLRISPDDDPNPILLGELGKTLFRARFNDRICVEAQLSEPAYAYAIAFNPAPPEKPQAAEQLIPEDEENTAPRKQEQLTAAETYVRLSDGVGLQAFAVVASRQPLPPYTAWRRSRPPLTWKRIDKAVTGVVLLSDGEHLQALCDPSAPRGTQEKASDRAAIRVLAQQLKKMPGIEAVQVMGFAVDPLD